MQYASVLLFNAVVLTLDGNDAVASALALDGDRILAVGDRDGLAPLIGPDTECRDMGGAAVLPGFYDAHGHILMTAQGRGRVNLNSPPLGTCRTLGDILAAIRARAAETPEGEWVLACGLDDTLLAEKRFPSRWELDEAAPHNPVFAQHISGHLCVLNSAALKLAGIDRHTPDPAGGIIRRDADGEPDGVLEESPVYETIMPLLPTQTREQRIDDLAATTRDYAARGITTAVDAALFSYDDAELLRTVQEQGRLAVRVHVNPFMSLDPDDPRLAFDGKDVTIGGVKLLADGSLQGYTGYLTKPYHTPYQGDPEWRGYPTHSRENLFALIEAAHGRGQFLIHTNGDAATDDALDALEAAQAKHPRKDCRHILIHAQTIREEQLDRLEAAGYTPSFFTAHVYYWGDRHRDLFLGPERAARMDPMRSALDRGLVITAHCDSPIVPADPLLSIWVSVNRLTSSGQVLGPDQRISVLEALRAHTFNPAWQNFQENAKGSIEPGKLADLVVLDANPLEVDPADLRNIGILETSVGGKTVYSARA